MRIVRTLVMECLEVRRWRAQQKVRCRWIWLCSAIEIAAALDETHRRESLTGFEAVKHHADGRGSETVGFRTGQAR
jgi:hypothetical protein